jgi:hypothetical protein
MDIDTDWCLNCGKQTNGELYCSSFCRNQDEKGCNHSSSPSEYGTFNDNASMSSGRSSPSISSYYPSSKYLNNPDRLLYYQSNDLKFRNRPSYDVGYYSPCTSSGLSHWLNQSIKVVISNETSRKNLFNMNHGHYNHHKNYHQGGLTNGFKGSFSSTSSESSYTSSSETVIYGSSSNSNDNLKNNGHKVSKGYYPWHKNEEEDEISLYEYYISENSPLFFFFFL